MAEQYAEPVSQVIKIEGEPPVEIEVVQNHCFHVGRTGLIIRWGWEEKTEHGCHISEEEKQQLIEALGADNSEEETTDLNELASYRHYDLFKIYRQLGNAEEANHNLRQWVELAYSDQPENWNALYEESKVS